MRWLLLVPLLLGACVHRYARVDDPGGFHATREVVIWTHARRVRLHGVTMLRDSIAGFPFGSPLTCDECRVSVPLSQVDSIVIGRDGVSGVKAVGWGLLFVYFLARFP